MGPPARGTGEDPPPLASWMIFHRSRSPASARAVAIADRLPDARVGVVDGVPAQQVPVAVPLGGQSGLSPPPRLMASIVSLWGPSEGHASHTSLDSKVIEDPDDLILSPSTPDLVLGAAGHVVALDLLRHSASCSSGSDRTMPIVSRLTVTMRLTRSRM